MALDPTWTTPVEYNPNEELPAASLNLMQENLLFLYERPTSIDFGIILDVKTNGTNGQTSGTSPTTRVLNTLYVAPSWLGLNSNQFSITEAGTYLIKAQQNIGAQRRAQGAIYDVTNAAYRGYGLSTDGTNALQVPTFAAWTWAVAVVTITATTVYELRLYHETAGAVLGFGDSGGGNPNEVYSVVEITKLA